MVKEPVNVNLQTVYAAIPFLDIYAALKIQKLRWFLVIVVPTAIFAFYLEETLFPTLGEYYFSFIIELGITVFIIRRWSKQWNEKIKS